MDVVNVFMAALPEADTADEQEKPSPQTSPVHSLKDSKQPLSKQDSVLSVVSEAPKMPVDRVPALNVHINLKNPQVVILANAKDKNTNALFLKVCYLLFLSATKALLKNIFLI